MSMIGEFGLCREKQYFALTEAARNGQMERAAELIQAVCGEMQASAPS